MTNGINNHTSDEPSLKPSRRYLRAYRAGAFRLRHQTDRPFPDRVEFTRGRRRLPFNTGRLIYSLFVAEPGLVALYESRRTSGRILGAVAGAAGRRGGRRSDLRAGSGRADAAHRAGRQALAIVGNFVAGG